MMQDKDGIIAIKTHFLFNNQRENSKYHVEISID